MGKPRKPQNRGDVASWSWLRLRERVAATRCHIAEHPHRWSAAATVPVVLTVEHYQTTFPAIVGFASSVAAAAQGAL